MYIFAQAGMELPISLQKFSALLMDDSNGIGG